MTRIHESDIEAISIDEIESIGYTYIAGPELLPDGSSPERLSFSDVLLENRVRSALARINPHLSHANLDSAYKTVSQIASPDLIANNELLHQYLFEGVPVTKRNSQGDDQGDFANLIDFKNPANNDFLVVNQFTIVENNKEKRPDILLFINGLPLVCIELKNAVDENTSVESAFKQIQTYKETIPSLFTYNAFCVISDGFDARCGTISADLSRFLAWKSVDGETETSRMKPQLQTLIKGMLRPDVILDVIRHFIVFEKSKHEDPKTKIISFKTIKKIAAYHQYYAVNKAVQSAVRASGTHGDRKGGVVWHTQGSGKSLSMVFFTGKLVLGLDNPTILVITDRNDLDDQLFDTFANCKQLLRQVPVQAESRGHLKDLLKVASGGIVFATIQKFLPEDGKSTFDQLTDRRNVVVIADEAHRTQYGFEAKLVDTKDKETKEVVGKRIAYGFAKHMRDALPNATFVGFTGTPIESEDVNTPAVFGQYIDIYDIARAVEDGATVRIYYESRLAKINLDDEGKKLVEQFDTDITEGEESYDKQQAKQKWTQLEAIVGSHDRIRVIAEDIVKHFEARQAVFDGKCMIVAMSRRIAVALYDAIIKLRPQWHDNDLSKGVLKVVMTSASADGPELNKHHTTKSERQALADRLKDVSDPLKLVIVRDMWLTGFDAPCLHTLYVDKPMKGHNLMQAIARVNRVFKDKPGGLVVDYLGIGTHLKKALSFYSAAGGKGSPTEGQEEAIEAMIEKLEVVRQMYAESSTSMADIQKESKNSYKDGHFDYDRFGKASDRDKLNTICEAAEHILGIENGKNRYCKEVQILSQLLALSMPSQDALDATEEIAFFQAVKARIVKFDIGNPPEQDSDGKDYSTTIRQIIDKSLSSEGVVDIFQAAGIEKPEISVLSEEFLKEVEGMKHRNLGLELLKKILNDEIKLKSKKNMVRGMALLEMLDNALKKYQNGLLTTAEIIQHLIELARELRNEAERGSKLKLNDDELAFYDALETNDSAVQVLGDDQLRMIAREIAEKVKANTTIDWNLKESARAKLMVIVKRTLNKYGYPPDKQAKAVETVLKQAEMFADAI